MTLQEQKELDDGHSEQMLRAVLADNKQRFGPERLAEILKAELAFLGIKISDNAS